MEKKTWADFRNTGLVLIINQLLHVFGWAIVFNIEDGKVTDVYPARVTFRGFDNDVVTQNYIKASEYMAENAEQLLKEAKE